MAEHEEGGVKTREIEWAKKNIAKQKREARGGGQACPGRVRVIDVSRTRLWAIEIRLRSSGRSAARRARDKATLTRCKASEKLVEAIDRLEEKIEVFKLQMIDREAEKNVALSNLLYDSDQLSRS
ncbi:hypothetical protein F5888DRAFT_1715058 [Russula emetica]|nr:hypothetical protein F5888DRAFT_1715058 [Russula emetica]